MSKIIRCNNCNQYLGEIRDAKLKIGMVCLCKQCNIIRKTQPYNKQKTDSTVDKLSNIFGFK